MIKKIMTLFLDTSVIGGYFDKEFERDTRLLFEKIKAGEYTAFISNLVDDELINAPQKVRDVLLELNCKVIEVSPECKALASEYMSEKVVGETSKDDCVHIATATINNIDVLVSWNFKHIVNIKRIRGYNSVNNETPRRKQRGIVSGITLFFSPQAAGNLPLEIKNGYRNLEIHSPKEMGLL